LKFFEKDSIPKTKGVAWDLRAKLGKLKSENTALNGGKNKSKYTRIITDNNDTVLAFTREKNGKKVIYIANLSSNAVNTKIELKGKFINYMNNKAMELTENQATSLLPFQYYILTE
jgi:sucrose-6-phosphate hydrolase SacC (GH32 family)